MALHGGPTIDIANFSPKAAASLDDAIKRLLAEIGRQSPRKDSTMSGNANRGKSTSGDVG
jgi:hypothetical protein